MSAAEQVDTNKEQPVKRKKSEMKKSTPKSLSQISKKRKTPNKIVNTKTSSKKDSIRNASIPENFANAVEEKQLELNPKAKEDDGISTNGSAFTGMSVDEEFSIGTEGAGKNALARLLSSVTNVEQV